MGIVLIGMLVTVPEPATSIVGTLKLKKAIIVKKAIKLLLLKKAFGAAGGGGGTGGSGGGHGGGGGGYGGSGGWNERADYGDVHDGTGSESYYVYLQPENQYGQGGGGDGHWQSSYRR